MCIKFLHSQQTEKCQGYLPTWFTCQTDLFWKMNWKILFLVLFWVTNLYVDPARYVHSEQTFILQLQQKKVKMWDVLPEATWKFETVSPTQWLTRAQNCYGWETWKGNYNLVPIYLLIWWYKKDHLTKDFIIFYYWNWNLDKRLKKYWYLITIFIYFFSFVCPTNQTKLSVPSDIFF